MSEEFASRDEILAPFRVNVNSLDAMMDLVMGKHHAPPLPGEPDKIRAPIPENRGRNVTADRSDDTEGGHPVERRETRTIYREAATPQSIPNKYAQVVKELDRFEFSEDETKRNRQMETIIASIRSSLQDLVIKEVAKNTRKAFGEYVKDIFKVGGGVKINFNFNGTEVSISARGSFTGDETICVARQDDRLVASVLRIDENGKTDLTSNFGITLGE